MTILLINNIFRDYNLSFNQLHFNYIFINLQYIHYHIVKKIKNYTCTMFYVFFFLLSVSYIIIYYFINFYST